MKSDGCSYISPKISVSTHDVTHCDVPIIKLKDLTIISRPLLSVTVFILIMIGGLNTIAEVSRISEQILNFYLRLCHMETLQNPKDPFSTPHWSLQVITLQITWPELFSLHDVTEHFWLDVTL
jgi:hypothetical protein